MNDAEHLLRCLFLGQPGLVNIYRLPSRASEFFTTDEAGLHAAAEHAMKQDATRSHTGIYYRLTTVTHRPPSGRGLADITCAMPALAADLDVESPGAHKAPKPLPPTKEAARALIAEAGLPEPTVLTDTGHGLQPIWRVDGIKTVAQFEALGARINYALVCAAEAHGWHVDTVSADSARVLRLPDTHNRKVAGDHRLVRVIGGTGNVLDPREFPSAVAPKPASAPGTNSKPSAGDQRQGPFDALDLAEWTEIGLPLAGWEFVKSERDGAELWKRPGDPTSEYSARAFEHNIVVHSEAAGLPSGKGQRLTKGRLFAHLWHEGDTSAAARDLIAASRGEDCTEAAASLPEAVLAAIRAVTRSSVSDVEKFASWGFNMERFKVQTQADTSEQGSGHFGHASGGPDDAEQGSGHFGHAPRGSEDSNDDGSGHFGHTFKGSEVDAAQFLAGQLPPIPLPGRTSPVPLPQSCPVLADFVTEVADAIQVPTDMPLTVALPVLAAASGGRWEVQVRPGWVEPLGICALVAQGSGERKSPVLSELERVVKTYQDEARKQALPTYQTQLAKAELAKKRYDAAMGKAGKSEDLEAEDNAIRLHQDWLKALGKVTPLPAWIVGADGTPESFVDQIIQHRALGIISSEPGLFGVLGGRYSGGSPNIEWFLNATSGERLTPHRIGRDAGSVERPVLSALSMIQPGRLRELGKVQAFRDSGLLARHLFCVSDSMLGSRERARAIDHLLRCRWEEAVRELLIASNKINLGSTNSGDIKIIRLTTPAADLLAQFDDELEPELTPYVGRYSGIGDWIAKAVGTAARVAGLLTLLNDPAATEVGVAQIADAVAIMRGYISHTMAAMQLTDPASDLVGHAKEVLTVVRAVCKKGKTQEFTRREINRKIRGRTWARTADALLVPLEVLVSHGFVLPLEPEEKAGPGRPPEQYLLNPAEPVAMEPQEPIHTRPNRRPKNPNPSFGPQDEVHNPQTHAQNAQNLSGGVKAQWPSYDPAPEPPAPNLICGRCIQPTTRLIQGWCERCSYRTGAPERESA